MSRSPAQDAVSPIIGVILMVAVTGALCASVFSMVSKHTHDGRDQVPHMTLDVAPDTNDGTGGVVMVAGFDGPPLTAWGAFDGVGTADCDGSGSTSTNGATQVVAATVRPGQSFDCRSATQGQTFILVYRATNTIALRHTF